MWLVATVLDSAALEKTQILPGKSCTLILGWFLSVIANISCHL